MFTICLDLLTFADMCGIIILDNKLNDLKGR